MTETDKQPPSFVVPANACDSHFHVFGPLDQYPVAQNLRYAPPHAPLQQYLELASHLGIQRMVFVQPSAYADDNRCMLDAMRRIGVARCRGVVDIDADVSATEWEDMHALGVRGVRINVSPVKPLQTGFSSTLMDRILALDSRCADHGWHLDFLGPGWLTEALLPTFARLRSHHSVAHLGMFLARDGAAQRGFQALIELAAAGHRRTWIKLTGLYRISQSRNFSDVDQMVKELLSKVPDRLIWGSDYPHLNFSDKVGSVELFNKLHDWTRDPAHLQRILADNPARLYGFE